VLEQLKQKVSEANQHCRVGLAVQTWGNVSGVDRASGHLVIKPSGVPYDAMTAEHMVVVSLKTGRVVEGNLRPSSDTPTIGVYRAFAEIGGIAHTLACTPRHGPQARRELPALGTTHADYFHGPVPCTALAHPPGKSNRTTKRHRARDCGEVQESRFRFTSPACWWPATRRLPGARLSRKPLRTRRARTSGAIGGAKLSCESRQSKPMQRALLDKHFLRKHGRDALLRQKPLR